MKKRTKPEHVDVGMDQNHRRITIAAARKMLGMVGSNYSDDDIQQVLNILYGMAEEAYEVFQSHNDRGN